MKKVSLDSEQNCVRINFHNRGLSKAVKSVRSLDPSVSDSTAIVQTANILKDIRSIRLAPQGFASIPELVGLDYVGYIVDKERLDKSTGQWIRIDEFRILGARSNSFKDSRVAYGQCYRYRMRSVVKHTKVLVRENHEKFDLQEDLRALEANEIQQSLEGQEDIVSDIDRITNTGLQHQSSIQTPPVSFPLSDNISVESTAGSTFISKTPIDPPSTTLQSLRQNANTIAAVDTALNTLSGPALQKLATERAIDALEPRLEYMSYYYESESSYKWKYVCISENVPPPAPSAIKISPNTPQGKITISWLSPANSQRDSHQFNLYKREKVGHPWEKIKTFAAKPTGKRDSKIGQQNLYEDFAVQERRSYIYALTTVDVHGIESLLSLQTEAQLNPQFRLEGSERPLKWISGSGARPDQEFSKVFRKFFEPELPIVAKDNIVIGPNVSFRDTEKKLLIRVRSLDIHEQTEFVITLRNENTQPADSE